MVAVAVFGLYGGAPSTWDLPPRAQAAAAFEVKGGEWAGWSRVKRGARPPPRSPARLPACPPPRAHQSLQPRPPPPPAPSFLLKAFWDTLSFVANSIVFFYTGVAIVNFMARTHRASLLARGLWRFPLVYVIVFALRFALLVAFRPLFRLEGSDLPLRDAAFATVAGLRGSVALILAQAVITSGAMEDEGSVNFQVTGAKGGQEGRQKVW